MKSFHVLASLNRGGIETLVLNLARGGLTDQTVVCSLSGSGTLEQSFRQSGVEICYCVYSTPHIVRFVGALYRLLRAHRPDVVHSHLGSFTVWVALAAKLAGIRSVVATYHSTDKYRPKWRHRLYLVVGARLVGAQVGVSQAVARWFADEYGLKTLRCVHNGVTVPPSAAPANRSALRAALGIPLTAFAIVNVANSTPAKDYPTFFKVAQRLMKAMPGRILFFAIGKGTDSPSFVEQARGHGVESCTNFLGERPDAEALLPAMDLFLNTSRWEGFSLSVVEAQAAGLPVVASRVGGIPEAVAEGSSAMLASPGKDSEYAERVLRILGDRELMAGMGQRGRANVLERLTIKSTIEAYRNIYQALVAKALAGKAS